MESLKQLKCTSEVCVEFRQMCCLEVIKTGNSKYMHTLYVN